MKREIPHNLALSVAVRDRNGVLFEGDVEALTSYNQRGEFDILPLHANFISIIKKEIILHAQKTSQRLPIETGILTVRNGKVEVYLGILSSRI